MNFFDQVLQQYFQGNPTPESKLLFEHPQLETVMLPLKLELDECDQRWNKLCDQEKEIFKQLPKVGTEKIQEELLDILRGSIKVEDFKKKYLSNESLFIKICAENRDKIIELFKKTEIGKKLALLKSQKQDEIEDKTIVLHNFRVENTKLILTCYMDVCQQSSYYFSDMELGMLAISCGKRLKIIPHRLLLEIGDVIEYGDQGEEVVIFHKGNHYSRCIPEKKRKRKSD